MGFYSIWPSPKHLFSLPRPANRTRLCEPNLVILCRLKTLGVVKLLYLPGRAHTAVFVSQLHCIQACSADLPALPAWILVRCLQQEISLSAALSSDWIDLSKRWMSGYPEQMAISQECWITYAERPLHQLHCPHVTESMRKCAVCLTQLGCVRFTLHRNISCAATVTEPNAFGPASVGRYI